MSESFYVVWQPEHGAPRIRHESLLEATYEAERLASINPGKDFFVLHAVAVSRNVSVRTEKLFDPLPF